MILILSFSLCIEDTSAAPGGKGKGKGAENGKGKGKGNAYAKGKEKHNAATEAISYTFAAETGLPVENFTSYAANLADTLGQLEPEALARVFEEKISQLP